MMQLITYSPPVWGLHPTWCKK